MESTNANNGSVTEAAKPVAGLIETLKSKAEIPAAARDLVIHSAETVREHAKTIDAAATKATLPFETKAKQSVEELVKATRSLQTGLLEDVGATTLAIEKLAAAKTLAEAANIQRDFLAERVQVGIARVKSLGELLTGAFRGNLSFAKESVASLTVKSDKAA